MVATAPNPFIALAQVIAKLKDADGRILIPGFYDKVAAPSGRRAQDLEEPAL